MRRMMFVRVGFLFTFLFMFVSSFACEIEFKVNEKYQKEIYAAGDQIVVELKVVLSHRDCNVAIENTKISATGCEITGATKWQETSPGVFERKLKVVVSSGVSDFQLNCRRTCDKDGGFGKIDLKAKV